MLLGVLEEPVEISQLVLIDQGGADARLVRYTRARLRGGRRSCSRPGQLPADDLITATAPLEHAQEMFERLESPVTGDVKILLTPSSVTA